MDMLIIIVLHAKFHDVHTHTHYALYNQAYFTGQKLEPLKLSRYMVVEKSEYFRKLCMYMYMYNCGVS